jgi:membrane-bound ClpP family serine protease
MGDVFLRVVTTISGPVLAAGWGITLLVWLKAPPPKAHPLWLAVLALGYALIAIPLYMGHGILILLAGQILVFFSAQALYKARQRYKDSNVHTEHIQHNS